MFIKGRTGPLCGSCSEGYGRRGSECRSCFPDALIIFLFLCSLAWFLIVVSIAIKGNLSSTHVGRGPSLQRLPASICEPSEQTGPVQEVPTSLLLASTFTANNPILDDLRAAGAIPGGSEIVHVRMPGRKNLLAGPRRCPPIGLQQSPERDLALRTMAETFKVCSSSF